MSSIEKQTKGKMVAKEKHLEVSQQILKLHFAWCFMAPCNQVSFAMFGPVEGYNFFSV
jgi:hypothetical protein